jgi:hypothetical protein
MPAFRGINFRSGDLAEQLGIILLQNLALVAPIPRTEDVGIDAVVTLIREYDERRYLAEDNFFVQIKSESVSSINFSGEQVKWLYALELPFFVASIDKSISTINLFCAHCLSDALVTNHGRSSITIFLDTEKTDNELVDKDDNEVHIGPPVMSWSLKDIEENVYLPKQFYEVIKSHIVLYKSSIKTRNIGWINYVVWKTNEPAKHIGFKSAISRTPQESLNNAYDEMMPFFCIWQQEIMRTRNWAAAKDVVSLLDKTKALIDALNAKEVNSSEDVITW